jgi:hypothetical protein
LRSTVSHFFLPSIINHKGDSNEILNWSSTVTSPGHTIESLNGLSHSISNSTFDQYLIIVSFVFSFSLIISTCSISSSNSDILLCKSANFSLAA